MNEYDDDILLDPNISEQEDEPFAIPSDRITNYVLGELHTKLTYGYSQSQLEEHLANASRLIGTSQLPHKYQQVLSLLRSLGYKNPKHLKVCIDDTTSYSKIKSNIPVVLFVQNHGRNA
jgi:hypothetical protein